MDIRNQLQLSSHKVLMELDATGVYGEILHYTLVIFFVSSAFLIFLYLWYKGKLQFDEEAKFKMLEKEPYDK